MPIPAQAGRSVVGAPRLNLTYTATGTSTRPDGNTAIFAQLVDNQRNVVVNNFATPIPIQLDGQEHTIDIPLERIASRTTAAGYTLQLIPQTSVYDLQRATGVVDVAQARIQIPLVKSGSAAPSLPARSAARAGPTACAVPPAVTASSAAVGGTGWWDSAATTCSGADRAATSCGAAGGAM